MCNAVLCAILHTSNVQSRVKSPVKGAQVFKQSQWNFDKLGVIHVLKKETVVSETSTTVKWVLYLLDKKIWIIFMNKNKR